jgi:DNA-binding NtrC family response regulator
MSAVQGGKIFLVDDEATFRRLAKSWLESHGHHVIDVADADAARSGFSASGAEVVLLDLATAFFARGGARIAWSFHQRAGHHSHRPRRS